MHTKKTKLLRVALLLAGFCAVLAVLVFTDLLPIGYKHVTYPQQTAFMNTQEAQKLPNLTCPKRSQPPIKLNYHVPGERGMYNAPVYATLCPTYEVTFLLYW